MKPMHSKSYKERKTESSKISETPYCNYLRSQYKRENVKRNHLHNDKSLTSKDIEWYLPDVFIIPEKRGDEIKMGRRIPVKKMNIWYPRVALYLKERDWQYYFVEDTKYEWHYYDMIEVLKGYYSNDYGKGWNSGVYHTNPQPWIEIPEAYRIKTIAKPQKYLWKS
jgi:hypothetical protein